MSFDTGRLSTTLHLRPSVQSFFYGQDVIDMPGSTGFKDAK
jgi:hypothetical protein